MTDKSKAPHYRIYLLTIWEERGRGKQATAEWRFSLKNPHTGQQRAFASLTALATALLEEIARSNKEPEKGGEA
jgi:hypothetical protein